MKPEVEGAGNRIILNFESLEQALQLLRPWRGATRRAEVASQIHQALAAAGLSLELRVNGRPVAEIGEGYLRGSLFSVLGMRPATADAE
jgi:hypothetical protein